MSLLRNYPKRTPDAHRSNDTRMTHFFHFPLWYVFWRNSFANSQSAAYSHYIATECGQPLDTVSQQKSPTFLKTNGSSL